MDWNEFVNLYKDVLKEQMRVCHAYKTSYDKVVVLTFHYHKDGSGIYFLKY